MCLHEYERADRIVERVVASARSILPRADIAPALAEPVAPVADGDAFVFANDYVHARVRRDGTVVELAGIDGRNLASIANGLMLYVDRPRTYDAWNLDVSYERKPRPLKAGAARIVDDALLVDLSGDGTAITMRVGLGAGEPYLRVELNVNWQATHRVLRAEHRFALHAREVRYGMPHGSLVRTAAPHTPAERARFEVPAQRWIHAHDGDAGIAILAPDTYGWSAHALRKGGIRIGTSLLRSPVWPDPGTDRGEHFIAYALAPTAGATVGALEAVWRDYAEPDRVRLFTCEDPAVLVVCDQARRRWSGNHRARARVRWRRAARRSALRRPHAHGNRRGCVRTADRGRGGGRRRTPELRVTGIRSPYVSRAAVSVTRTIDTVLFDLDDTLHDDSAAYKAAARRVADDVAAARGIDAARLFGAYVEQANSFWKTLSQEHLSLGVIDARVQMWSDALVAAGLPLDVVLAEQCATSYGVYRTELLELSPGALELVIALRERGCKLGIVTNGFAATHHEKVDRLGLRPYVDGLFLADEMQMVKPDPEIFRYVCRTLGSVPERTAMVGDRYDRDIVGAGSVGLFTVLIDVHAIPLPDGAVPPDAVVDAIGDVFGVLPLGGGLPLSG